MNRKQKGQRAQQKLGIRNRLHREYIPTNFYLWHLSTKVDKGLNS